MKKLYDYLCRLITICLHHSTLYSWDSILLPSSCCSPCRPICLMFSFFFSTSFEKVLIFNYLSICIYIYTQFRITIHQSTVRIHIIIYLYTKMDCFPHLEKKKSSSRCCIHRHSLTFSSKVFRDDDDNQVSRDAPYKLLSLPIISHC